MPDPLRLRHALTGDHNGDVGTLTHILVGAHVQFADTPPAHGELLDRMFAVAFSLIDANPNATRVLAAEAASHAHTYLTCCVPAAPWALLGVEHDTGDGRVDLAWTNPVDGTVMFDEIKASRVTRAHVIPSAWLTQARRYAAAGAATHGPSFLGTRLIPAMAVDRSRLVTATGLASPISPTPDEPLRAAIATDMAGVDRMTERERQAVARARAAGSRSARREARP